MLSSLRRIIQDYLIAIAIRFSARLSFHKGFTIAHLPIEKKEEAIQDIKAAIDLIESSDSRRFLRVTNSVNFIFSTDSKNTWTFYLPHSRTSVVNVARVRRERPNERERIGTIAALIVGCSVDAVLYKKGISPSKRNGRKIERLRYAEMKRFLQRVVSEEAEFQRLFLSETILDIFPDFDAVKSPRVQSVVQMSYSSRRGSGKAVGRGG